jgi:hypothetical protein
MAARAECVRPKAFAILSRFSDCGSFFPRSMRPMVVCATPDFFASAVCVFRTVLDAIKLAMARLQLGLNIFLATIAPLKLSSPLLASLGLTAARHLP